MASEIETSVQLANGITRAGGTILRTTTTTNQGAEQQGHNYSVFRQVRRDTRRHAGLTFF